MDLLIIAITAAFASLLTFFSGFGLSTILTPVFILFFPLDLAIALTGIVHLLNNLFKMILVGNKAVWEVAWKFGLPAIFGAYVGAKLLFQFSDIPNIGAYTFWGNTYALSPVNMVIAFLMIFFALFEIIPSLKKIEFGKDKLPIGGVLSGFFGGLSGHQGALRSTFLLRYNLGKEAFIATGIVIATFIDVTRLIVYFTNLPKMGILENLPSLLTAVFAAFLGAYIGRQLLEKLTMSFVQWVVTILIIILALGLGLGIF